MLVTCGTPDYYKQLHRLLGSYRMTNPGEPARIYGLDWPAQRVKWWRRRFPAYQFIPYPIAPALRRLPTRRGKLGGVLRLKPKLLLDAYRCVSDPLIWIDADTLVCKPVQPIIDRVYATGDFGVTKRRRSAQYLRFAVAVLIPNRNARGDAALQAYCYETDNNTGLNNWFYDQIGMAQLEDRNEFQLVPLTEDEHTLLGNVESAIISARKTVNLAKLCERWGWKI